MTITAVVPAELLRGMRCLVTGAGRGNGQAVAAGLAAAGASLALVDIDAAAAAAAAAALRAGGARACAFGADVADRAACAALADTVARQLGGDVGVLVNNAGILHRGTVDELARDGGWERSWAVNVNGPFNMVAALLPQLRRSRGAIVNLGSILSFTASPNTAAYATSKGAVLQLTKSLAAELAPEGIRVNAIAPGIIDTAMSDEIIRDPARLETFLRHVPMGRVGRPDELVGAVVFLASPMASYVTGVMLPVDGGFLTR